MKDICDLSLCWHPHVSHHYPDGSVRYVNCPDAGCKAVSATPRVITIDMTDPRWLAILAPPAR